jgi:hypothetical protein
VRVTREDYQPEGLRFRDTEAGLSPYRPTHIVGMNESGDPIFPIESIRFGPSLRPERTGPAIRLYYRHVAAEDHPIRLEPQVTFAHAGYVLRP